MLLGLNKIDRVRLVSILIVLAGLFTRLLIAKFEWVNMDEGCYINDANMVLSGLIPIKDFFSREPLFPFILSLFYSFLGKTLFAARLMSVSAGSIIVLALYKIGTQIFDRKVGMLAATIYALSPYVIDWGVLIKTEVVSSMFTTLAVLALAIYIKDDRAIFPFISGLFLGTSVLIRRSAIATLLVPVIVLVCKHRVSKKSIIIGIGLVFLGFLMTCGSLLVYLIGVTDLKWVWNILGLGELIHPTQPLIIRLVVFWSAFMMLFYMIISCILFALDYLMSAFRIGKNNSKTFRTFIASLLCLSIVALSISGSLTMNFLNIYGYGVFYSPFETNLMFVVLVIVASSFLLSMWPFIDIGDKKVSVGDTLVIVWLLSYVVFYTFYTSLFTDYFNECTPSLSLAAALGLAKTVHGYVNNRSPNFLKYVCLLFSIVVVLSAVVVAVFVIGPYNPYNRSNPYSFEVKPYNFWDRSWDPSFVQEVADYIASISTKDEEIFTADVVFVSLAQRKVVYNISYPHHYIDFERKKPLSYDPYHLTYSIAEIINRMETRHVRLAIVGPRTLLMCQKHPELQRYIELKYELLRVFGDPARIDSIKIYVRTFHAEEEIETFEDFSNATTARDWITLIGNWNFTNGTLTSEWSSPDWHYRALMIFDHGIPNSLLIEADVKIIGEGGIVLRYKDSSNYYLIRLISSPAFEGLQLIKVVNGTEYEISSKCEKILKNTWYHIKIIAIRNTFIIYVNSTLWLTSFDETFLNGKLGLSCNYGASFDNIYVTNNYTKLIYPDC